MDILLFIYLISNSFPADAKRDTIYQLVKSQKHFSQSVFRTLKGPSVDSLIENLFALAIEAEDVQMVKTLITAGANVNANNCKFKDVPIPMTPLQFASLKNNAALVQELIAAESEIDAPESGWKCSAILLALYGHEQLVRWDGIDMPKPVDYEQLLDVVQKLLDGGASVNNGGKFPINETTKSIRQWRSELEPGSQFYELVVEEHSPLTLASKNRYHRVVDFLIKKGADARFSMDGTSSALRQCLHRILFWFEGTPCQLTEHLDDWEEESEVRSTIASIARSLIRAGADLNDHVVDECDSEWCDHSSLECYSNLDLAILVGDLELVDEMLRADAKPTYHSLDLAIKIRSFDLFSKFLAKGAAIPNWAITEDYSSSSDDVDDCSSSSDNVDASPEESKFTEVQKRRALVLAAVHIGATSELKNIIESMDGFDNLLDDCTGLTRAIEDCCTHGHLETLQYLLAANIMPNPRPDTLFGRSVLLSIQHQHNLLDLLIENNADLNVAQPGTKYRCRELPLSLAIKNGHLKTVRKLIQAGASVEDDLHGTTREKLGSMLVAAIGVGNEAVVDEVLGACGDINGLGKMTYYSSRDSKYCTPLTMAIRKRNWMLVDILRRDGAKVNHPDQGPGTSSMVHHHTALWAATSQRHLKLVESLFKSGAVINDRMALEAAVDDDNLLSLFIDKLGAAPRVNKKFNALHFALRKSVGQGSISKVKLILDSKLVDLNSTQGGETLHKVLGYWGQLGVNHTLLNMLLAARANPNAFVSYGKTAIHYAIERDDARSVQMILDAGAEVSPPFLSAVYYSPAQLAAKSGNTEVLQLLLAHGCDPNAVAPVGQSKAHELIGTAPIGTALQCATESKRFEAVQLLLMKRADPNAVTEKLPHTALQIACRDGSKNIVELLTTEGTDVNAPPARKFGATALQFAALGGYLGIAHLLLENGADVNAAAAQVDGRTALEAAAEYGRIDMIQFLVDAGADLSGAGNGQYERAKARAYNNGHHATHRLLLSYRS
ncbi:ankyrin repeat-containing domain protein [Phaeosphaeriaceae sp. PMI808]|nr:ankyrin repeat-containing domain protein [Phaeosphaeriaceae sp. PMI808]